MFHVFALRPWKRTYATECGRLGMAATTFEARVMRRVDRDVGEPVPLEERERVRPLVLGSIQDRWRNSTSGTSGSSRARARSSSAFASGDFVKRGWYCRRTPRSFPESSSGSSEARNSANAWSVGSRVVPRHRGVRLHVERELGRRALRPATRDGRIGEVVVGRVDLDRVEALRVVAETRLRRRHSARVPGLQQALVGEAARPEADRGGHGRSVGPGEPRGSPGHERLPLLDDLALRREAVRSWRSCTERAASELRAHGRVGAPAAAAAVGAEERPRLRLEREPAGRSDLRLPEALEAGRLQRLRRS